MLDTNTVTIHDVGYKDGIFYLDVIHVLEGDCNHKSIGVSRDSDELEYIWILLKHDFSYINTCPSVFPSPYNEDVYWDAFAVFLDTVTLKSIPLRLLIRVFTNATRNA